MQSPEWKCFTIKDEHSCLHFACSICDVIFSHVSVPSKISFPNGNKDQRMWDVDMEEDAKNDMDGEKD